MNPDAIALNSLAAAYAEVGNFEDAIDTQNKAISLVLNEGDKELLPIFKEHLEAYKAHKPWRMKKPEQPGHLYKTGVSP